MHTFAALGSTNLHSASAVQEPPSNSDIIGYWGTQQPTSVTLKDLCEIGLDRRRRLEHAQFLHRELRIRLAQRTLELLSLPYGLPERPGICEVIKWYSEYVQILEEAPVPTNMHEDEDFTRMLDSILHERNQVMHTLALGVQDLMAELGADYEKIHVEVDAILRRFFMARIGLRFLLQHHVESLNNREGHSGIIQLECEPAALARKAAADCVMLCKAHLGQSPEIVIEAEPGTFTYVPMHLYYMMTEVFKNSLRAVVEHHGEGGFDDWLPPVRCRIVHGCEDVTLKISDEGGGISRSRERDIWKFMYSTYKKSPWASQKGIASPPGGSVLAGYGVGLSLSQLYARYFGGDLKLLSIDCFGTDVYLHLSRLGAMCESLPQVVLYSPSMRDSSISSEDGLSERLLISADEEAFLRKELSSFRRDSSGSSIARSR